MFAWRVFTRTGFYDCRTLEGACANKHALRVSPVWIAQRVAADLTVDPWREAAEAFERCLKLGLYS